MEKFMYQIGQTIKLKNGKMVKVIDIDTMSGQIICTENGVSSESINISEVAGYNKSDVLKS